MESMPAREDVELPIEQLLFADIALLQRINRDKPRAELVNVLFDRLRALARFVHLPFEILDSLRVGLESIANLVLEVVNDDKVWEVRQYVFDGQQLAALDEGHGPEGASLE